LETCQVGESCRHETSWLAALEASFDAASTPEKPISEYTRRNTRFELRNLFALAEAHGLLAEPLPPTLLTPITRMAFEREQRATSPYRSSYKYSNHRDAADRYALRQAEWPPDIVQGWRAYRAACGRRIRETTFAGYVKCLETYLGYLTTICGRTPTWEDVFDVTQLNDFVSWHGQRVGQEVSAHGWHVVIGVAAMAKVIKHPRAAEVAAFSSTVQRPPELHNKREYHWVPLKRIDEIADVCLAEGRRPYISHTKVKSPGVRGATRFQRGLILKLLTRVPLRSRNVREMELEKHLRKDRDGHWQLTFRGRELKVGTRKGKPHVFSVDLTKYCPPDTDDLIPTLEEFINVYRPRLPNPTNSRLLFLTQLGTPYDASDLRKEIASIVARYTGQRLFPHMIRSIWATEMLEKTNNNYRMVATMLGDTVAVVMRTYDTMDRDRELGLASDAIYEVLHGD
jgi:hypothetical protein